MNGFEKRRQKKKEQILQSLTKLIMTRNFKEIGVREIAEQAGVSPASIYNFFGSKEMLAKEVFYYEMDSTGSDFIQMINSDLPFKEKMERMYELSVNNQESLNSEGMKNFMFEDPSFKQHVEQYAGEVIIPEIMKLIEQGQEENQINGGVSAEAIMIYMQGLIAMMGNPSVAEKLTVNMRKELGNLFFYGIFGKKE